MGYDILACAMFSCIYFYMTNSDMVGENWRRLFFYAGFLMIFATFGLALTGSSELMLVSIIWMNVMFMMIFVFADVVIGLFRSLAELVKKVRG